MLSGSVRSARLAGAFVFCLGLLGCAAPQTRVLLSARPPLQPAQVELARTPFFAQEDYQCGPAALATVLTVAGVKVSPEQLQPLVFVPERRGSFAVEMLAAARRNGALAYELQPKLGDLLSEVAAGHPVVVLQNLSLPIAPVWHYAVAIGYDLAGREITLRSGRTERLVMPLDAFEHTWKRSGYWAMVALTPGKVPASAREEDYLAAVIALEKTALAQERASIAAAAYSAAVTRWPRNLVAHIGLGNTHYARRDLNAAASAYRRAIELDADSAVARNNLAQVLYEQGDYQDANAQAQRALALARGGPHEQQVRATLAAIAAALGQAR